MAYNGTVIDEGRVVEDEHGAHIELNCGGMMELVEEQAVEVEVPEYLQQRCGFPEMCTGHLFRRGAHGVLGPRITLDAIPGLFPEMPLANLAGARVRRITYTT